MKQYIRNAREYVKVSMLLMLAGISGGCLEELTRYNTVNARTPKQAAAINTLADAIGAEENYQRNLNVAERGATVVYGNGQYNGQLSEQDSAKAGAMARENAQIQADDRARLERYTDEINQRMADDRARMERYTEEMNKRNEKLRAEGKLK